MEYSTGAEAGGFIFSSFWVSFSSSVFCSFFEGPWGAFWAPMAPFGAIWEPFGSLLGDFLEAGGSLGF